MHPRDRRGDSIPCAHSISGCRRIFQLGTRTSRCIHALLLYALYDIQKHNKCYYRANNRTVAPIDNSSVSHGHTGDISLWMQIRIPLQKGGGDKSILRNSLTATDSSADKAHADKSRGENCRPSHCMHCDCYPYTRRNVKEMRQALFPRNMEISNQARNPSATAFHIGNTIGSARTDYSRQKLRSVGACEIFGSLLNWIFAIRNKRTDSFGALSVDKP